MAVTIVESSPSFSKEFNNIIQISDYTNKVLFPNKDTIAIPTDSLGNNGVFTEATASFIVFDASQDVTSNWTLSLESSSNCTVTVSDVTKIATVSAISSNTANFLVKASKAGEEILYRKITVYKAKAGVDGSSTPDGETIVLDGYSHLKVNNHQIIDNGTTYNDCLIIGPGSLAANTGDNTSNVIAIQSKASSIGYFEGCDNVISIGSGTKLDQGLGSGTTILSDGVVVGHYRYVRPRQDSPWTATQFVVIAAGNPTYDSIQVGTGSCVIGVNPRCLFPNAVTISLDKSNNVSFYGFNIERDISFVKKESAISNGSATQIDLDISMYQFAIVTTRLIALVTSGTDVYTEERHITMMGKTSGTALINYSNTSETYKSGAFSSLSATYSVTSGVLSISMPDTGSTGYMQVLYEVKGLL